MWTPNSLKKTLKLGKIEGEEGGRGWDGWIASSIQWTWTWANSGRWWGTRKPGMLQSTGMQSQTRLDDGTTAMPSLFLKMLSWGTRGTLKWCHVVWGKSETQCPSVEPGKGGDRDEPLLLRVQPKPQRKGEGWRWPRWMGQEDERTEKERAETDSKAAIQTFKQHPIKCDDVSPTFSQNRCTISILINLVNNNFFKHSSLLYLHTICFTNIWGNLR